MFFSPAEVIRKKRDGLVLSEEELRTFFAELTRDTVKDYQASALLMAIVLKGMNIRETATLTKIMRDSGRILQWSFADGTVVDKHSTGGIGDKTSLVILPLCALEGVKVPMMSGRGLGHTGGTLDKLEAIPGINVRLDAAKVEKLMQEFGAVFMGQSEDLAPLDKRLYALRDVTGTVESIPLITASIVSKKACEGLHGLVMDVKFGSGAFMQEYAQAKELAQTIQTVATECGVRCRCLLTDMNSPLGRSAGNALEVLECIEILQGTGPEDTVELCLELATEMVQLAFPKREPIEIKKSLQKNLRNGTAFSYFCKLVAAQGGDSSYLEAPRKFAKSRWQKEIWAEPSAKKFISAIDVRNLGLAVLALGGGRKLVTDKIDASVGLAQLRHVGEESLAAPLAVIHANDEQQLAAAEKLVQSAYSFGDRVKAGLLIKERI